MVFMDWDVHVLTVMLHRSAVHAAPQSWFLTERRSPASIAVTVLIVVTHLNTNAAQWLVCKRPALRQLYTFTLYTRGRMRNSDNIHKNLEIWKDLSIIYTNVQFIRPPTILSVPREIVRSVCEQTKPGTWILQFWSWLLWLVREATGKLWWSCHMKSTVGNYGVNTKGANLNCFN